MSSIFDRRGKNLQKLLNKSCLQKIAIILLCIGWWIFKNQKQQFILSLSRKTLMILLNILTTTFKSVKIHFMKKYLHICKKYNVMIIWWFYLLHWLNCLVNWLTPNDISYKTKNASYSVSEIVSNTPGNSVCYSWFAESEMSNCIL